MSMRRLSIEAGINRISLMRFMDGVTELGLGPASKLADYLGLELRPKKEDK